jgi:hypothetical protein
VVSVLFTPLLATSPQTPVPLPLVRTPPRRVRCCLVRSWIVCWKRRFPEANITNVFCEFSSVYVVEGTVIYCSARIDGKGGDWTLTFTADGTRLRPAPG